MLPRSRLVELPYQPALPPDFRYRDLCVTGAPLAQNAFNDETGGVNAQDVLPEWTPASPGDQPPLTAFDEKLVGKVSGAKPPINTCMPLRDTPRVWTDNTQLWLTPNVAFSYLMNMGNGLDPNTGKEDTGFTNPREYDTYQGANYYRRKAFFIGDSEELQCPDFITVPPEAYDDNGPDDPAPFGTNPDTIPDRAEFQRFLADTCYNYYILNHALKPWYTMERPKGGTDDPLSVFDPDRSFLNNCQPLVKGDAAINIQYRAWYPATVPPAPPYSTDQIISNMEKTAGFAPVYQYPGRPDMDEAEYLLSGYLQKVWDRTFDPPKREDEWTNTWWDRELAPGYYTGPHSEYKITLDPVLGPDDEMHIFYQEFPDIPVACRKECDPSEPGNPGDQDSRACNAFPNRDIACVCPDSPPCPTAKDVFVYPWDPQYVSKGTPQPDDDITQPDYCPNVEKITEPSGPFSPRGDLIDKSVGLTGANPYGRVYGTNLWGPNMTDRDYSSRTSVEVSIPFPETSCEPDDPPRMGYTDFNADIIRRPNDENEIEEMQNTAAEQIRHPVVQCAIVPVDILSFRAESFNACIMQRINLNYRAWVAANRPDMNDPDNPSPSFNPPCKTRFFERDDVTQCPTRLSIQQCCRIIVKDVVPANYLKLRTCEGLMQNRRDNTPMQGRVREITDGMNSLLGLPALPEDPSDPDLDNPEVRVTYVMSDGDPGTPAGYKPQANAYNMGAFWNWSVLQAEAAYMYATGITIRLSKPNDPQCYNDMPTEGEPDEYQFKYHFREFRLPAAQAFEAYPPEDPDPGIDSDDPLYEYKAGGTVGYHMPYMRWWDTGVSAGQFHHGGSFVNTLGSYDVLVGVGREERDLEDATRMKRKIRDWNQSNNPDAMDDGGDVYNRMGEQPAQMGRVGGWSELKAHQMWSIRRNNLYCIGRYEKLFKPGGPEQLVLAKAGAGYTSTGALRDPGHASCQSNPGSPECLANPPKDAVPSIQWPWTLGWRGYVTDNHAIGWRYNFPYFPYGTSGPGAVNPASIIHEQEADGRTYYGLDNALPGDIIAYCLGGSNATGCIGLPQIAYVTDIGFDEAGRKDSCFDYTTKKFRKGNNFTPNQFPCTGGTVITPNRVFVTSWDQGKFPTSTGSSLNWGQGTDRIIYRNQVPDNYRSEVCGKNFRALTYYSYTPSDDHGDIRFESGKEPYGTPNNPGCLDLLATEPEELNCMGKKCQPSCDDPEYKSCVLQDSIYDWNAVAIYRPYLDVRKCTGTIAYPEHVQQPPPFDLETTYQWTGIGNDGFQSTGDPNSLPRPNDSVIYQNQSHIVNTSLWSFCANAGYDPPPHWNKEYKGAQTGAITDATLCGPEWHFMSNDPNDPNDDVAAYPGYSPGCATSAAGTMDVELFPKLPPPPP